MGLADRFKEKLNETNIFNEPQKEQNTKSIHFVSKPQNVKCVEINPVTNVFDNNSSNNLPLNQLKNDILAKIKNTPYWNEYSAQRKENMIKNYFETKLKKSGYSDSKHLISDNLDFIRNILNLTNI